MRLEKLCCRLSVEWKVHLARTIDDDDDDDGDGDGGGSGKSRTLLSW